MVIRDRLGIDLLDLYDAVKLDAFAAALLKGEHRTMASKITSRLCRAEKAIRREIRVPGGHKFCYFQAAGRKPLGPEALARALTVANFCIYGGTPKLSAAAMRKTYPFMPVKGNDYCLIGEGLCRIKVDRGGDADRIVRRLCKFHLGLYHHEGYRFLIQTGRFSVRVVVPSPSRADQLHHYLEMSPSPYPVIPVVDDDLLELT